MSTPSISPEFGNNPGFATIQVIDNQAQNLEFKYLNLSESIGPDSVLRFKKYNFEEDFGIKVINAKSISQFYD